MELSGKRVGIVIATGYHDHEFWFPYYRFREAGADVLVAGPETGTVRGEGVDGKNGLPANVDLSVEALLKEDLDALYLPGGIFSPLRLRSHAPTLDLVRASMDAGRVVAAICHAQWILVSAGVLGGRKLTCPGDMRVDVENAGGTFVDEPAVRDGNLFTAVYFGYLPEQFRQMMPAIAGEA
jgi:protease I